MSSYKNIIKSTGLVASVQVVSIICHIVRNKVVAIVLGASGFGIWGLYNTFIETAASFSSLGLNQSGVRQIAKSDDAVVIAKCIWVFRRSMILTSLVTALISIVFSKTISMALFNTEDYYLGVIIVSFTIFCRGISRGQVAVLNGLRDMRGLAISQIIGTITGSITCIMLVFLFGVQGIPIYLLAVGITAVLSTWWFVRKLKIKSIRPPREETVKELKQLLSLGLGFSVAGLIAAVMTGLSQIFLRKNYDLDAVGIYRASWTISNIYIGTILTAMGVDFMPRIMKLINKPKKLNSVTNEQIELGVLVSTIGAVGILIFSPLVLHILYSSEFTVGIKIIRWQVLGVIMRVIAFPFSYIIMAYNRPGIYATIQVIFWTTDFLLLILFSTLFGFDGLGINYFVAYILYLSLTFAVCCKICGFMFSKFSIKIFSISSAFIVAAWLVSQYLQKYNYLIGSILVIGAGIWMFLYLKKYMRINVIQLLHAKILKKMSTR